MAWNPDTYNKYKKERYAPFYDLLEIIEIKSSLRVTDLGCGTGELTRMLADHLPSSEVLGIDASEEMLHKAASYRNERVQFICRTVQEQLKIGDTWDLIFSNAALQWIDDHQVLFPALIGLLNAGGQLAIQVPSNHHHYSHIFLQELAGRNPYRTALSGYLRKTPVLTISEYATMLNSHGAKEIVVYEKVYPHLLENAQNMYEWVSGTALIPYIERLPFPLQDSFKNDYRKGLEEHFPETPVFYPFNRILMAAQF